MEFREVFVGKDEGCCGGPISELIAECVDCHHQSPSDSDSGPNSELLKIIPELMQNYSQNPVVMALMSAILKESSYLSEVEAFGSLDSRHGD